VGFAYSLLNREIKAFCDWNILLAAQDHQAHFNAAWDVRK
jgi:hypothetical protein